MQTDTAIFACYILYIYFRGRDHTRIEREMRSLGYPKFHRRILYPRAGKSGWIARFTTGAVGVPPTRPLAASSVDRPLTSIKRNASTPTPLSSSGLIAGGTPAAQVDDATTKVPHSAVRDPQFQDWLRSVSPNMTWSWRHQQVIIDQLQKVTTGECKRLMIFLPPRHGKSELVTVRYTAWRMQQDPSLNVILGGYNQRLADRFSRKIRKVISEAETLRIADCGLRNEEGADIEQGYRQLPTSKTKNPQSALHNPQSSMFPFAKTSRPANTVSEWETLAGGGFRAVGVGSGVTGFGAKLVVIDDPVKSRAEAESETYRERVWDWFKDDLYTRLEPDGAVILIQTRWHEDDLAGRLLSEMHDGGEHWDVVELPAISETPVLRNADFGLRIEETRKVNAAQTEPSNEARTSLPAENPQSEIRIPQSKDWRSPGEPLCPERYDLAALKRIRRRLGEYSFAALYQQRPTPAGGGVFKREWFKRIVQFAPPGLKWARGYDLAVSTKTNADYTASFRCAFDNEGNLYISGGFRSRLEYPDQRRFVIDRVMNEPDTQHGIELALHGNALLQDLRRERGLRGHLLRGVRADTDKHTRALSWAPLAEEGKVILVRSVADVGGGQSAVGGRSRNEPDRLPYDQTTANRLPPTANWLPDFLDEISAFPNGPHDDQVDAVSIAVQLLKQPRHTARGF